MCSILDIDIDYFNLIENPSQRLHCIMAWACRPVDFYVEEHHNALKKWKTIIKNRSLPAPSHILHVDEHHDMMDEQAVPNIGNAMLHAMRLWPQCKVYWLVDEAIDFPEMWLDEKTWKDLAPRFGMGSKRPRDWPRPDIVSVCTSPPFVSKTLKHTLLDAFRSYKIATRTSHCH